jgi:putative transposase
MTRQRSLRVAQRAEGLLPRIQALKAEHPFWGDRCIWPYWRVVDQWPINKKRILRLRREHRLLVTPNLKLKAKRTPSRSKPRPHKPNAWWGIDMTKVLVEGFGWIYIVVVLDWYTRLVYRSRCGLPRWHPVHLAAVGGSSGHGREPPVPRRGARRGRFPNE